MPARLRSWTTMKSRATAGRRGSEGSEGSAGSGLRQVESHNISLVQNQKTPDPLDSSAVTGWDFPDEAGGKPGSKGPHQST